jgi:hypothetical protein
VRPLPLSGRPANFSGLVGDFRLTRQVSKTQLHAKESATVTVVLEGRGNVGALAIPTPPENPAYKIYEDKPAFNKRAQGNQVVGSYSVKWGFVPLAEGSVSLPPLSVTYFNPDKGTYETSVQKAVEFTVLPALENENLNLTRFAGASTPKQAVELLGKDVMPLHKAVERLGRVSLTRASPVCPAVFLCRSHALGPATAALARTTREGEVAPCLWPCAPGIKGSAKAGRDAAAFLRTGGAYYSRLPGRQAAASRAQRHPARGRRTPH